MTSSSAANSEELASVGQAGRASATTDNGSGWDDSARAWIETMGEAGDLGRRHVLDPAFRRKLDGRRFRRALDVGCGEGRMCRLLRGFGVETVGIDPTPAMIEEARRRDPSGDYRLAGAEQLPFPDAGFDLAISCLSLIDIPDYRAAITEMARVLQPGGVLLVANLTPLQSAGMGRGWRFDAESRPKEFGINDYLEEWSAWVEWSDIRILNWHRPLSAYVQAYLAAGLSLISYEDLTPEDGYPVEAAARYARVPWFDLMEWRKIGALAGHEGLER